MKVLFALCAICGAKFEGRTSYGLCKDCWSRDRLREWDRIQSAIKYARNINVPADLSLIQWLSVLSDYRGCCAYCEQTTYSIIEIVDPLKGLTWHNIVPACKACSYHKRNGFETAKQRVRTYLSANINRSIEDIDLEDESFDDDWEDHIPMSPLHPDANYVR